MRDLSTHDVLRRARAYLLEHGWKQGDAGFHGGSRCLMGAIESVGGSAADPPCYAVLSAGLGGRGVRAWNDHPDRTLDEVIAALDAAISATAPPLDDTPIFQALESLPADEYIEALSVLALLPMGALA